VAKEARALVQEAVSELISFLTSEASEACFRAKRKTLSGDDIVDSLEALGFDNFVAPMKAYRDKYKESDRARPRPACLARAPKRARTGAGVAGAEAAAAAGGMAAAMAGAALPPAPPPPGVTYGYVSGGAFVPIGQQQPQQQPPPPQEPPGAAAAPGCCPPAPRGDGGAGGGYRRVF